MAASLRSIAVPFERDNEEPGRSSMLCQAPDQGESANGMVRPCSCRISDRLTEALNERSTPMAEKPTSVTVVIGIDIGKNTFHVVGLDDRGAIVLRQKWSRGQVETRLAN